MLCFLKEFFWSEILSAVVTSLSNIAYFELRFKLNTLHSMLSYSKSFSANSFFQFQSFKAKIDNNCAHAETLLGTYALHDRYIIFNYETNRVTADTVSRF